MNSKCGLNFFPKHLRCFPEQIEAFGSGSKTSMMQRDHGSHPQFNLKACRSAGHWFVVWNAGQFCGDGAGSSRQREF
jgi:hypothetical protein